MADVNLIKSNWHDMVSPYMGGDSRRSKWMLADTLLPFLGMLGMMVYSLRFPYWVTLLLAIPTAGLMMRTFIIFHDCGHGSFFPSKRANEFWGFITGVLTFTPHKQWWRSHAIHHATAGDLDRRGTGDVLTLTVEEYRALPWLRKLTYRVMRTPWILFTVGAPLVFLVGQRFWSSEAGREEKRSVITTNLTLTALIGGLIWLLGWWNFIKVLLPYFWLGTVIGVWLFYVQHQFEDVYWARHSKWDYLTSALEGASLLKLPVVLEWFSGHIGYHHIHHLAPRIPNYKLKACYLANLALQIRPLSPHDLWRSLQISLYDEANQCMVGWGALKTA